MIDLTDNQLDVLRETINIGIGRAAGVLNEMAESVVHLQVPDVKVIQASQLEAETRRFGSDRLSAVRLGFSGSFTGTAAMVFATESASKLVAILTGEELGTPDLDSVKTGTLSEVGNIVLNGVMGSIGNVLGEAIGFSLPSYVEDSIQRLVAPGGLPSDATVVIAQTHFTIERLWAEGDVILLFEMDSFEALLTSIDRVLDKSFD